MNCALCDANLEARQVWRLVRNANKASPKSHVKRRVKMKPHQLVVEVRLEGSFGGDPASPSWRTLVNWAFKYGESVQLRLCVDCLRTCKTPAELMAVALVALDKRLDDEGKPACRECGAPPHEGDCSRP